MTWTALHHSTRTKPDRLKANPLFDCQSVAHWTRSPASLIRICLTSLPFRRNRQLFTAATANRAPSLFICKTNAQNLTDSLESYCERSRIAEAKSEQKMFGASVWLLGSFVTSGGIAGLRRTVVAFRSAQPLRFPCRMLAAPRKDRPRNRARAIPNARRQKLAGGSPAMRPEPEFDEAPEARARRHSCRIARSMP